jgi:hypothetical protein
MRGNRRLHPAPHRAMVAQAVVISQQCESRGVPDADRQAGGSAGRSRPVSSMTAPGPEHSPNVEEFARSGPGVRVSILALPRAMKPSVGGLTIALLLLAGRTPLAAQEPGPPREMLPMAPTAQSTTRTHPTPDIGVAAVIASARRPMRLTPCITRLRLFPQAIVLQPCVGPQ